MWTAREVLEMGERTETLTKYANKYNPSGQGGMSAASLANPENPWEVFFRTAR